MPKSLLLWNERTNDITLTQRDDATQTVTTETIGTAASLEEASDVAFTARPEITMDDLFTMDDLSDPVLKEIPEDLRRRLPRLELPRRESDGTVRPNS